jgi:hypothetical protein
MSHGDLMSLLASGIMASGQCRRSTQPRAWFCAEVIQPLWQKNHNFLSGGSETLTQVFGERQVSIRVVLGLHFIIVRIRFLGILRLGAVVPGLLSLHSVYY